MVSPFLLYELEEIGAGVRLEKEMIRIEGKDNRKIFFHFFLFYFSRSQTPETLYKLPNLISETTLLLAFCFKERKLR